MELHTRGLQSMDEIRAFVAGSQAAGFAVTDRDAAYQFIGETLHRFSCFGGGRADKGTLRAYLIKITGLSRARVTRLIGPYRHSGRVRDRRDRPAQPFRRYYTDADCRALAELDPAPRPALQPAPPP